MQQNYTKTQLDRLDTGTLIAQASTTGSWQVLPYQSPVVAIHLAVLRTGKVLFMGGSSLDPNNRNCPNCSAVWDVNNGTFNRPTTPNDADNIVIDLFCSGHSFRSDGRLLVAGGTQQYNPYKGSRNALLFNPSTEQWEKTALMNSGRWYPSLVTLGNGRVLAVSGLNINGSDLDLNPEIYNGSSGWNAFSQPTQSRLPMYAGLTLMQDGRVFFSGSSYEGGREGVTPRILTLPSRFNQQIAEQEVPGLTGADFRNQAATVLLPPAQDQRVMIVGGGSSEGGTSGVPTTNNVSIADLKVSNPTYTSAAPLNSGRIHHNAILLPDRTVFVCNGSTTGEGFSTIPPAEIYNPATNTWTVVAAQTIRRIYHGTAVLLPDGRVLSAGSAYAFGIENHEYQLEIYSPAYISQPRPVIQQAPTSVRYGNRFTIRTPQAGNIKWVSLIRPMATTHALDTEQRLVDVPISSRNSTSVTVSVTSNRNLAPPGYYMLFITDNSNIPSVASWIRVF